MARVTQKVIQNFGQHEKAVFLKEVLYSMIG